MRLSIITLLLPTLACATYIPPSIALEHRVVKWTSAEDQQIIQLYDALSNLTLINRWNEIARVMNKYPEAVEHHFNWALQTTQKKIRMKRARDVTTTKGLDVRAMNETNSHSLHSTLSKKPVTKSGPYSAQEDALIFCFLEKNQRKSKSELDWVKLGLLLNRSKASVYRRARALKNRSDRNHFTPSDDASIMSFYKDASNRNQRPDWNALGLILKKSGRSIFERYGFLNGNAAMFDLTGEFFFHDEDFDDNGEFILE